MKFYWNDKLGIYYGEMIEGDREATDQEILADNQMQWRNKANSDFRERKELYIKNISYADAIGRDSSAIKLSLQRAEDDFKDRILKINQGINPFEVIE